MLKAFYKKEKYVKQQLIILTFKLNEILIEIKQSSRFRMNNLGECLLKFDIHYERGSIAIQVKKLYNQMNGKD